jgi:hypothetical protein
MPQYARTETEPAHTAHFKRETPYGASPVKTTGLMSAVKTLARRIFKVTFENDLRNGGIGSKDRRAALTREFLATLDATHGNSAQSKSLRAILDRAASRYAATLDRKASKAASKAAEAEPVKPRKASRKASKATAEANGGEDTATTAEAQDRASFVKRMRKLAAQAESEGERV